MRSCLAFFFVTGALLAGPVEFGKSELARALRERGMDPTRFPVAFDVGSDAPEAYRILPGRITGGDQRGLMYGLLAAAEQIRLRGRLTPETGTPATPMRGIRVFLHNHDLERDWYYSHDYWDAYFAMLARCRFNRFNLVFAHQTAYLAPPYPYWFAVDGFPDVRVPNLSAAEQRRNLEALQMISRLATDYGIDFTIGIWQHNVQTNQKPSVAGLTAENIGPYSYAALKKLLALCPNIRSVQMRTNSESGIPQPKQVEFYRDHVYRAIREAGHRVTLDLRGWLMAPQMFDAALNAGVPLRLSSKYWAEDLGRPYQPATTFGNYSFLNFLEKPGGKEPRRYDFYWELWGLGSHRLLLWGDAAYVRRALPTFRMSGSVGFEIDPPLAQKGYGNRPGTWGVFTNDAAATRKFWRWEFERYWLFYMLWGRIAYEPKTPDTVWQAEMRKRMGEAGADVLEAYAQSSRALNEIVAAHLADPNMYIWPEINPGGLIDSYREVRPSDQSFIATIAEAVANRLSGTLSAKQTPTRTAAILDDVATRAEQALARARTRVDKNNREWHSTESDLTVLALLARYHARKQRAADALTEYYATSNQAALDDALAQAREGLDVWKRLVAATGGVYPEQMAFGPDDIGHWKHKLPYVEHDVALLAERKATLARFGTFAHGFDFGGPVAPRRGPSYHNETWPRATHVEPRFRAVDADTLYSEATGYGWVAKGERTPVEMRNASMAVVRGVANDPRYLPSNALLGDSIRGRGAQAFRVRTGEGDFTAVLIEPTGATREQRVKATGGVVDIVFPEGEWNIAGLLLRDGKPAPPRPAAQPNGPRPTLVHYAPKSTPARRPLALAVQAPATAIIRLHYRALNQLAPFKTIEQPASRGAIVIPAAEIDPRWDLQYYFEITQKGSGAWFLPDPEKETPYFVVKVE